MSSIDPVVLEHDTADNHVALSYAQRYTDDQERFRMILAMYGDDLVTLGKVMATFGVQMKLSAVVDGVQLANFKYTRACDFKSHEARACRGTTVVIVDGKANHRYSNRTASKLRF